MMIPQATRGINGRRIQEAGDCEESEQTDVDKDFNGAVDVIL